MMGPAFAMGYRSALRNAQPGDLPCCGPAEEQGNFRELVERMYPKVFSVAYAMLGCAGDAEVAAQRAFTRLTRKPQAIDRQREVIERLYRFAMNYCVLKLRLRRARDLFRWFPGANPVAALNTSTDERAGQTVALALLAVLPPKERALLVLREVADQPVDAVARIVKMRAGAVRTALVSARRRLLKRRCPK